MLNLAQQSYWDKVASRKIFHVPLQLSLLEDILKRKPRCIMDVGCGYGRNLQQLRELGIANLNGVDYSENMIKRAKRLVPDVSWYLAHTDELPFETESVDLILMVSLLGCFPETSAQCKLIEEVCRVLTKGGAIYIADFLINNDKINQARYNAHNISENCPYGVFNHPEGIVLRHHTIGYISDLTNTYFNKKYFTTVDLTTMNNNQGKGFIYLGEKK